MNENQNQPKRNEPGNLPPAETVSSPGSDKGTNITATPTEQDVRKSSLLRRIKSKMKRNWLEYLLEFLLVVTAVFLGFLADSIREKKEDRQKEKKYIQSLLRDIEDDTFLSAGLSDTIFYQAKQMDTLQGLLGYSRLNDADIVLKCYELAPTSFKIFPSFFNERTITQLLSSGSMRLIKDQDVADSIMAYHNEIKFLETQRQAYINAVNICIQSLYDIFDISILGTSYNKDGILVFTYVDMNNLKLRTTDENILNKFIVSMERAKIEADAYSISLAEMNERAKSLLIYFRHEYNISENQR